MPVDAETQGFLERVRGAPSPRAVPIEALRAATEATAAQFALAPEAVSMVRESEHGRLYEPVAARGVVVYDRVVVAGDSAGGNLAAACADAAHVQALIQPVLDLHATSPSIDALGADFGLPREHIDVEAGTGSPQLLLGRCSAPS